MDNSSTLNKPWMLVVLGILIGLLSAGLILFLSSPPSREPVVILPTYTSAPIWVEISGAVNFPGAYSINSGSRVKDVIEASGGCLDNADLTSINLVAPVTDGQKIIVPPKGESAQILIPAESQSEKINLNIANQEQIETLPGIGPKKAKDILNYRMNNGPFQSLQDLLNIDGIGEKTLEEIEPYATY